MMKKPTAPYMASLDVAEAVWGRRDHRILRKVVAPQNTQSGRTGTDGTTGEPGKACKAR